MIQNDSPSPEPEILRDGCRRWSLTPAKVALAATAAPMPALADDVAPPQLQPIGQVQPASQMQVTGRVTYSRFLELWHARATKLEGSVRACEHEKLIHIWI